MPCASTFALFEGEQDRNTFVVNTKNPMKKTMVYLACIASFGKLIAQEKRNYVSPTDTSLTIYEKFNNPMRAMWGVGGNVGVDVSTFSGGVYAEGTAYFTPKYLAFRASYAKDVSNSDFISKSALLSYGYAYSNFMVGAVFNFKDKVIENNIKPTVGFEKISETSSKITGYPFYSDYIQKTRKTTGIGISINQLASNTFYNKAKVDTSADFIQFANGAKTPSEFILGFKATTIGLVLQMGQFTSNKVRFAYKNLPQQKIKNVLYQITTVELLFAPAINNASNAFFIDQNKQVQQLDVESVKKRRIGFKLSAVTNKVGKFLSKPGLYMSGEVGLRPGIFPTKIQDPDNGKIVNQIFTQPFYMKFGIGFSL